MTQVQRDALQRDRDVRLDGLLAKLKTEFPTASWYKMPSGICSKRPKALKAQVSEFGWSVFRLDFPVEHVVMTDQQVVDWVRKHLGRS